MKVWQDEEAWYAEAVTIPQAHVCGGSRAEVLDGIRDVLADLKSMGLLAESAELANVAA